MTTSVAILISTVGLFLVAVAYAMNRSADVPAAHVPYWCGQLLMYGGVAWRLLGRRPVSRRAATALVLAFGVTQYLAKICYTPNQFTFFDELQHWRGSENVLATHHLFGVNFALPISSSFPALETITSAVVSVTGLSVHAAGLTIAGLCRLAFVLILLFFFADLLDSPRGGAVAVLIYGSNPHFQYFDALYNYQTVALTFLALTVWAVMRADRAATASSRWSWRAVALVGTVSTVASHHVTGMVLVAILVALFLSAVATRQPRALVVGHAALAALATAWIAVWVAVIAPATVGYLKPSVVSLVRHQSSAPATPTSLPVPPLPETLVGLGSVALLALLVPGAVVTLRRYRRGDLWAVLFAAGSLCFYLALGLKVISPSSSELVGRALTYLYLPLAYVLPAAWLARRQSAGWERNAVSGANVVRRLWLWACRLTASWLELGTEPGTGTGPGRPGRPGLTAALSRRAVLVPVGLATACALSAGGLANGWPPFWERLPGRFQVGGFERSVSPQGIAAAEWSLRTLGPGNRVSGDLVDYNLMGTYGDQDVVRGLSDVYYEDSLGDTSVRALRLAAVRYVVVDSRLATGTPVSGGYFADDTRMGLNSTPIDAKALDKFDRVAGSDRIYDSGDIQIYDVSGMTYAH